MPDKDENGGCIRWLPEAHPLLVDAARRACRSQPGAGVTAQDETGRVVGVNEESPAILGLTVDQMLGRTSIDPRWSAVSESAIPLTGEEHPPMVSLRHGIAVRDFLMGVMGSVDAGELGLTIGATRWAMAASDPVFDTAEGSDEVIGVVTTFRDAGDSRRARRAQDRQAAAFQFVAQNAEDVVLRTDADDRIVWVSVSVDREMGWRPRDLVGGRLRDLVHPDDGEALTAAEAEPPLTYVDRGPAPRVEFRVLHSDSSWRWVSDAVRQVQDAELRPAGHLHTIRDIDREVQARQALADSEKHYRLIAENALDLVVHVRNGHVAWASPAAESTLTDRGEPLLGLAFADLVHPADIDRLYEGLVEMKDRGSAVTRLRMSLRDGRFHWVEVHLRPYRLPDRTADDVIASGRVVDDVVRAEAALERQARFDALTGLLNRGEAIAMMGRLLQHERRRGEGIAVLFCDVDNFKSINDNYGHAAGDAVLRTIATRIEGVIRKQDVAARLGGDELLVILVGVRDPGVAEELAELVAASARTPVSLPSGDVSTTVSIGVATAARGDSVDDLIERADAALYRAKHEGRARVVVSERNGRYGVTDPANRATAVPSNGPVASA